MMIIYERPKTMFSSQYAESTTSWESQILATIWYAVCPRTKDYDFIWLEQ